ncbi:MAG: CotH kinase family protein, partial [Candidatus Fimadaptatus sp.]
MKKVFLILMAALTLGLCAAASGSAEIELEIYSADDFIAFTERLVSEPALNAQLMNDIDMSGAALQPVGLFNGKLEGNGFELCNLSIETNGGTSALFLEIGPQGEVRDLQISGLFAGMRAASLAEINRGSVVNVSTSAELYATELVAGIVCENDGIVEGCANKGNVLALNGGMAGGVVGVNRGSITGCVNHSGMDGSIGTPFAAKLGGICVESLKGSVVRDCVNLGRIQSGDLAAGLVCTSEDATLSGLKNFGGIYSTRSNIAGIVCDAASGSIADCANYGEIICSFNYGAGIVSTGSADLSNCDNYGAVMAVDNGAGIASVWEGTITGCRNHAPISGHDNTAGICTQLSGSIADCANLGEVLGESHMTAGVVAEMTGGTMARCINSGHVSGGTNGWGDSIGTAGVVARAANGVTMEDVCNVGLVESTTDSCGALVALMEGTLYRGVNCSRCRTLGEAGSAVLRDVYGMTDDGFATVYASGFYNGELAWLLNTDNGTVANRGVWSQGSEYLMLADEEHQPARKITCTYQQREDILYTSDDGKVQPKTEYMLYDVVCTDEDGNHIANEDIFRDSSTSEQAPIAYVSTPWDLSNALSNSQVAEVVLLDSFEMDRDLYVSDNKRITGRGFCLDMGDNALEVSGCLTLNDLCLNCDSKALVVKGGTLTVEGFLEISAPIELSGGTLDLSAGRLYNASEIDDVPSILTDEEGASFDGYTLNDGAYYAFIPQQTTVTRTLVAPAELNSTLAYDIYPEIRNGMITFFLPCTADLSQITVCTLNDDGERVETYSSVNMMPGNTSTIRLFGLDYPVQAMQSSLPTLSFDINEDFGTIDAMNGSEDHSVYCYGNVRLDVTQELQEKNDWFSFISTENNPERDGTMRIRGRGNSTWSTHLDLKKPYQFQMEQKVDVLGMGKHKTWILLMNDETLVKNKLGLDLAQDIGLTNSSLGEFVDVFMNGRYLGNYLLCERVEISKERVNIAKLDDEYEDNGNSTIGLDLTGGYLIEFDNWGGDDIQVYHEASNNIVSIEEPEDLDSQATPYNAYGYIYQYITDFLDAVYGDGLMPDGRSYLEYIDIDSFVRYYFHQEYLMNADNGRGST